MEKPATRSGLFDRLLGGATGAVLGLVAGLVLALLVVGFGSAFVWTVVAGPLVGLAAGAFLPSPFLFLLEVGLGLLGIDL